MNRTTLFAIILAFLIYCPNSGFAQDSTISEFYHPKAILVQLNSEKNRIDAFKKDRQYKMLANIQNDVLEIWKKTIYDFNKNIVHSKVYYYIDTNIEFIKNRQFDGVLLDTNLSLATDIIINKSSGNDEYLIAYYGYPETHSMNGRIVKDSNSYITNNGDVSGRGLIVLNAVFRQVNYFYMFRYNETFFTKKRRNRSLYYRSKHFDIVYFPYATLLDETIVRGYSKGRVPKAYK